MLEIEERAATIKSDFLDGALAVDRGAIKYHIEFGPELAIAFVSKAEDYNDFTWKDLVILIQKINEKIPAMQFNEGNCNNGRAHHSFLIGNEGSRVIYLKVRKFYLPEDYDYQALGNYLKDIGKAARADELNTTQNDRMYFEYRFWWD